MSNFLCRLSILVSLVVLGIVYDASSASAIAAPGYGQPRQIATRRLPPVSMDSFVQQAGGAAESIYGDEGVGGKEKNGGSLPPIDGFGAGNRIDAGIFGMRDAGLTTGHGINMPSAWGADEHLGGEWAQTGAGHFEEYTSPTYNAFETAQRLGSGSASAFDMATYTGFP